MSATEKRNWTITDNIVREEINRQSLISYCEEYEDFAICSNKVIWSN